MTDKDDGLTTLEPDTSGLGSNLGDSEDTPTQKAAAKAPPQTRRRRTKARRAPAQRAAPAQREPVPAPATSSAPLVSKKSWIILEESEDIPPTGLFVSHNGNPFLITTGVPVAVPEHILSLLDDAVMSAPQIDPTNKRVLGYRERMRYPYRRVAAPRDVE